MTQTDYHVPDPGGRRKRFVDLATAAGAHCATDINGMIFGTFLGETFYQIYERGQLTCPWCGTESPDRVTHKYHITLYCEQATHAHHRGD